MAHLLLPARLLSMATVLFVQGYTTCRRGFITENVIVRLSKPIVILYSVAVKKVNFMFSLVGFTLPRYANIYRANRITKSLASIVISPLEIRKLVNMFSSTKPCQWPSQIQNHKLILRTQVTFQ